jgi:uncharacterized membrane protein
MKDLICALWGLGICGGLLLLMVIIAVVWAEINLKKNDSFFEKDK